MEAAQNNVPVSATTATPQRKSQFLARLLSWVVLWALFLLILLKGGPLLFNLTLTLVAAVALWEFYTLLQKAGQASFKYLGIIAGSALIWAEWFFHRRPEWSRLMYFEEFALLIFVLGVFLRQLPQQGNPKPIET